MNAICDESVFHSSIKTVPQIVPRKYVVGRERPAANFHVLCTKIAFCHLHKNPVKDVVFFCDDNCVVPNERQPVVVNKEPLSG